MRKGLLSHLVAVAFCSMFFLCSAQGQYRASIRGTVTDPQGAVVPGATITLTNQETSRANTATTNAGGVYNFNGLPPSVYTIKAESTGFKQKVLKDIKLIAEQANSVNIQLEVGQASQTVTVTDAAPLLDTETGTVSGTIDAKHIQTLPSFGRDVFQLLQLAPGAFGDGAQSAGGGTNNLPGTTIGGTGGTDGSFKIENGGQITANGARTGENNYQIDGVGTTSVTWGGTSVITPNEDSVKEVKVVTDNYDAENGRYRGAQVQVISQNGTNQYHGSLFFKAHRPGLNAYTKYNGYNSNLPGCVNTKAGGFCGNKRDENRFNDWGGTAGGPIVHNKLFAFFSYETIANNAAGTPAEGWYETPQFRALAAAGTNAAAFYNFPGVGPNGGTQVDQTCAQVGLVEGQNCHFIAGQGLNLGKPLTLPRGTRDPGFIDSKSPGTGGDGSGGPGNLTNTPDIAFFQGILNPSKGTHRQYNGRVDFNATSKDLVAFSFYYVPNSSTSLNGNGTRLMNHFNSTSKNRAATLLWDRTLSPSLINEVRVNAAGWANKDLDQNPDAPFGLPQVSFNVTGNISGGVKGYGIGSFNGFDQWTYAGKDVLTKITGAHLLKMGGEFTRLLSVDAPFWADRPSYTFNNIWDFLNDAPVTENAQFDPQTGVPSALRKDLRSVVMGLFFQDNYKVRPNLTVTAGLRWDYFGPVSETKGKLATTVFGSGASLFTNMRDRTGGNQFNAQKTNFGPQLSAAWSPRGVFGHDFGSRLVIRGGIGIAYNGVVQSNTLDTRFNPPFVANGQTFSAAAGTLTYINTFPSNVHDPNGYAANPNAILTFGANNLPLTCCTDLTALPADLPTTRTVHYTLGAEYDLGHRWVASAGYQGSQTRHLTTHFNLYDPGAVAGLAFNPVVHGVTFYDNNGNARFNALLLQAKHQFSNSFLLDTQYRFSHTMDPGSNAYAGPFYQWDLSTGFATSDYDVRHAFKAYGVWSPTIFRGSHSWMEKVIGGWSLSGILNAHTGFPWTPQYNSNDDAAVLGNGRFDPVFSFGPGSGGSSSNSGNINFLPVAFNGGFIPNYGSNAVVSASGFFTPPTVVAGTLFPCLFPNPDPTVCPNGQQGFGPIPPRPGIARNSFRGPGYFDVDATLSKSFGLPNLRVLGEGAKLEVRANFYNLFNKLNLKGDSGFNGIQTNILNNHFGQSGTALGARVIEMQARFSF